MQSTAQLSELVSGYSAYAHSDEMVATATGDAPASSWLCSFFASFGFSYHTTNGPGDKRNQWKGYGGRF